MKKSIIIAALALAAVPNMMAGVPEAIVTTTAGRTLFSFDILKEVRVESAGNVVVETTDGVEHRFTDSKQLNITFKSGDAGVDDVMCESPFSIVDNVVRFPEDMMLEIVNEAGAVVMTAIGGECDITRLTPGVYIARIDGATLKFVR